MTSPPPILSGRFFLGDAEEARSQIQSSSSALRGGGRFGRHFWYEVQICGAKRLQTCPLSPIADLCGLKSQLIALVGYKDSFLILLFSGRNEGLLSCSP